MSKLENVFFSAIAIEVALLNNNEDSEIDASEISNLAARWSNEMRHSAPLFWESFKSF